MQIRSESFPSHSKIPVEFAFGKPGEGGEHVALAPNRNPHLVWTAEPAGTKSFVLVCIDVDAPSSGDDVNKEGRSVPGDLPRVHFAHWLMIDIPLKCKSIAAGSCCDGITPHGKHDPNGPAGSRQGRNDYTGWLASDPDMAGQYLGYDGPCPPWNDSVAHHYHFRVYAVDTPKLDLPEAFSWTDLKPVLQEHILDQTQITGTYSLNPAVTNS